MFPGAKAKAKCSSSCVVGHLIGRWNIELLSIKKMSPFNKHLQCEKQCSSFIANEANRNAHTPTGH